MNFELLEVCCFKRAKETKIHDTEEGKISKMPSGSLYIMKVTYFVISNI